MSKVCVIILNWNNPRDTIKCVESVIKSDYFNFKIIIIDNGSSDDSVKKILEWFKLVNINVNVILYYKRQFKYINENDLKEKDENYVTLLLSKNNLGYGGGNNIGILYALKYFQFDYIWILNNDTIVDKAAMKSLVKCLNEDKKIGMAGSQLIYMENKNELQCAGGCIYKHLLGNSYFYLNKVNRNDPIVKKKYFLDYICGASLMIKKEVIEKVGVLDESFFLYWEDAEWCIRAIKNGYKLIYCPKSIVYHKEGGTAGKNTPENDYYWVRNGLYLTKNMYPFLLPIVMCAYFFKYTFIRFLKNEKLNFQSFVKGVFDFLKGKRGKR